MSVYYNRFFNHSKLKIYISMIEITNTQYFVMHYQCQFYQAMFYNVKKVFQWKFVSQY